MADDQLFQRFGKEFPRATVLFREGDPGNEMYVIQSGQVTISKRVGDVQKVLTTLGAGEFFGEMSILNNKPRSATATCADASKLLVIDAKTFEAMIRGNAEIALRMIKKLADRLQETNEQIENLLFHDASSRVVHFLATAAERSPSGPGGHRVDVPPAEVSGRLGIRPEQVDEVLQKLLKAKIVGLDEAGFVVPDVAKLHHFLEFLQMKAQYGDLGLRLRVLGCSGGELPRHRTTCFLVDGTLAIDAGALTSSLSLQELVRLDDIVLTHSHFDHVKDVPLLADLLIGLRRSPVRVHASRACARTLRESVFNGELWPDFTRIPDRRRPVIEIVPFTSRGTFRVGRYTFQPVPVRHPVQSVGFTVTDGRATIGISGDTGPTEAFWKVINACPRLSALLVELSFPSSLQWLADVSGHLTPLTLRGELEKLERNGFPVLLYHYKPAHLAELRRELTSLRLANVRVLRQGEELRF